MVTIETKQECNNFECCPICGDIFHYKWGVLECINCGYSYP